MNAGLRFFLFFCWGGGDESMGWYLRSKHRDATRVARSFWVSTPVRGREDRGALDTIEGETTCLFCRPEVSSRHDGSDRAEPV